MTRRKKKTDDPITLGLIVMSATALAVVLVAVALAALTGWLQENLMNHLKEFRDGVDRNVQLTSFCSAYYTCDCCCILIKGNSND